ncbi:MAG: hypothetical protein DWQ21_09790 [Bacteroidetes bacterium]|nr:MAG: hypothetical protein DWQ21_09790 [Bacteroidota bacterium]
MYFSLLTIFLSGITALFITTINLWFIPGLFRIQQVGKIYILLTLLTALIYPLRYLFLGLGVRFLSNKYLAKVVKEYDGGRFNQSLDLGEKGEIGEWSYRIALLESKTTLGLLISTIKYHWTYRYILIGVTLLTLVTLLFYRPLKISTEELITGQFRTSEDIQILPDTIQTKFYTEPDLSQFLDWNLDISEVPSVVIRNSKHKVLKNGRLVKELWIVCDSVISVTSWSALITSPSYTNIQPYRLSDTIKAISGSSVAVNFKGLLTEYLEPVVSRETKNNLAESIITTKTKFLEFSGLHQSFQIPVQVTQDFPPNIEIIDNNYDSLVIKCTDDFRLDRVLIESQVIRGVGLFSVEWKDTKVSIEAYDNLNQHTRRTVQRPQMSYQSLESELSQNATLKVQQFKSYVKSKEQEIKGKQPFELRKRSEKKLDENKNIDHTEPEQERLDVIEQALDELWEIQKLINALEMVSRETNEPLDSVINTSINELNTTDKEELREELDKLKSLDKSGGQREEQAKDSAQKLKQLLAESTVDIQSENVERLKRMLKNSWKTSVVQEVNKAIQSGSRYREQRTLLTIQREILDSLEIILITDPMLGRVLNDASTSITNAVKELESALLLSKNIEVKTAYMVTALNDLNAVLYDILQSEKQSLASSKKECKKGRPGKTGKPSKGKKGNKPSKKTSSESGKSQGKKPGKKGVSRKPAEQGKMPGEQGKGTKELLKEIDNKLNGLKELGDGLQSQKLEELKRQLLFGTPNENESQSEFENRLWESFDSEFQKEEQGQERKANIGDKSSSESGTEIIIKPSNNTVSDLPLPVLKKK